MQRSGSEAMAIVGAKAEAWYLLQELTFVNTFPLALKAALDMRIPDILFQGGSLMTATQVADKLPRRSHDAAQKLERILRLLAHKGVVTMAESEVGKFRFGLTDVSKCFVSTGSDFDLISSYKPGHALHGQRQELRNSLEYLRETVQDGANGFVLANGADIWIYAGSNPEFNSVFNAALLSGFKYPNEILARYYEGFRDVKCLVNVGGGVGGALGDIVRANPHIHGKNLDLPHVISSAPAINGVEHVPGNFLEFIPSGDAMLLQQVLHNWNDEDCITILKNCHNALPENGKVIIRNNVINLSENSAAKTNAALNMDLLMMAVCRGKERTAAQWEQLLKEAGFSQVSYLNVKGFDIIEAVKTD